MKMEEDDSEAMDEEVTPEMALKFEGLCRLCMKEEEGMLPIFTEESNLSMKLAHILPKLEICAGDGLPSQVCQQCVRQVDVSHRFFMQCEVSDATFRKYLITKRVGDTEDVVMSSQESDAGNVIPSSSPSEQESLTEKHNSEISSKDSSRICKTSKPEETRQIKIVSSKQNQLQQPDKSSPARPMVLLLLKKNDAKLQEPKSGSVISPSTVSEQKKSQASAEPSATSAVTVSEQKKSQASAEPSATSAVTVSEQKKSQASAEPSATSAVTVSEQKKSQASAEPSATSAVTVSEQKKSQTSAEPSATSAVTVSEQKKSQTSAEPSATSAVTVSEQKKSQTSAEPSATSAVTVSEQKKTSAEPNSSNVTTLQDKHKISAKIGDVTAPQQDTNGSSNVAVRQKPVTLTQSSGTTLLLLVKKTAQIPNNGLDVNTPEQNTSTSTQQAGTNNTSTTPLLLLQQHRTTSSGTLTTASAKPDKYFIPVNCLQQNKTSANLNVKKPMSESTNTGSDRPMSNKGSVRPMSNKVSDRPTAKYKCYQCRKMFPNKQRQLEHMGTHELLKCNVCGKICATMYKLRDHSLTHMEPKRVAAVCDECGQTFTTSASYKRHRLTHQGIKPHQCPQCKNCFTKKQNLKSHLRMHAGEKPYICEKCGSAFVDNTRLLSHKKTVHEEQRKLYSCPLCPKVYTRNESVKLHLAVHSGAKPFQCMECGRAFAYKPLLKKHLQVHSSDRKYVCSFCHKRFRTSRARDKHLHTHKMMKPCKCEECDITFTCEQDMSNHRLEVHGEEPPVSTEVNVQNDIQDIRCNEFLEITVPNFSDDEFLEHFRISRQVAEGISKQYAVCDQYRQHSGQYGNIPPFHQVLIFLWYIGQQRSSFRNIADRFGITISSLHRIIQRVVMFLSNLSPQIITWPHETEIFDILDYFRNSDFPEVMGVIGGTHIKIAKPEKDPKTYLNSKRFYSIQMQAVVDHSMRFRDVFIGYPGSIPESKVFQDSPLSSSLEEKCGQYCLLGDLVHPSQKNLVTPFKDRLYLTPAQMSHNEKVSRNLCLVNDAFVLLKQKFRQMCHVRLRSIFLIINLIRATCVLHNLAIDDKFPEDINNVIYVNNPSPAAPETDDSDDDTESRQFTMLL